MVIPKVVVLILGKQVRLIQNFVADNAVKPVNLVYHFGKEISLIFPDLLTAYTKVVREECLPEGSRRILVVAVPHREGLYDNRWESPAIGVAGDLNVPVARRVPVVVVKNHADVI